MAARGEGGITIKSAEDVAKMRATSRLARSTLEHIEPWIRPGASTQEINDVCHRYIVERGAWPSPLNYHGFPRSVCTSPNEVICHGIPSEDVVLGDGDILNVDVTTRLDGFHGDTNKTYLVGNVSEEARRLVDVTYRCMMEGIARVRPGGRIGDIGHAISEMARDHGYGVVRDYCGHGIGREFHEPPVVVHVARRGTGAEMRPGMTFTVEPMLNIGTDACRVLDDGWTVVTADGRWSAQFEHTVLVTEAGRDVLTIRDEERAGSRGPGRA